EALIYLMLQASFWEIAAYLSALVLVYCYGRRYGAKNQADLVKACDKASLEYPQESQIWLELMVDAAMGGRLLFSWIERPLEAVIRLNIGNKKREEGLQDFAKNHIFNADHRRLEELYRLELKAFRKEKEKDGPTERYLL